jgi:hypothetical protein
MVPELLFSVCARLLSEEDSILPHQSLRTQPDTIIKVAIVFLVSFTRSEDKLVMVKHVSAFLFNIVKLVVFMVIYNYFVILHIRFV